MKAVTKHMPSGTTLQPDVMVAVFKEIGFKFDSEACPIKFKPPWFSYQHNDGAVTYVQLQGSELEGNPIFAIEGGRM